MRNPTNAASVATASPAGPAATLETVHRELLEGMPTGALQEVRILTSTLEPGDRTPRHTHRFPVTVYVLEGTFTLELDGRTPITASRGEVIIEPPQVAMTGLNPSPTEQTRLAMVYVSDPDTSFADLAS